MPTSMPNCWKTNTETMEKKIKTLMDTVEKEVLHKPSQKTLNRLALLAGFQNWAALQRSFKGEALQ